MCNAIWPAQTIKALTGLFKLIKSILDQWKISKTIPIHKKGPEKDIEKYRPIAILCSTSKIFEKLILKRIIDLQDENSVDLTRKQQHSFKKNKSTTIILCFFICSVLYFFIVKSFYFEIIFLLSKKGFVVFSYIS